MKKAILLPMLCLIALCACEKSTELSEITGNTGNSENPETETPDIQSPEYPASLGTDMIGPSPKRR